MSEPTPTDAPFVAPWPSLPRLVTPALVWLVVGLAALLGALGLIIGSRVDPPDLSSGGFDLLIAVGVWGGGLVMAGGGIGSALNGLWMMLAYDRAEAISLDEAPDPVPSSTEGRVAGVLLGACMLLVGLALSVGLLAAPPVVGTPVVLHAVGGLLIGAGLVVGLVAALRGRAHRPALPLPAERATVGLSRPVPHLHLGLLVLLTLTAVGLQLTLIKWVVEDAAISFAYARHLAGGEGLVTFPGGERVEGYSNPLWTFLVAAFYLVGIDGFASNKIMSLAFGALTVPLTWAIVREARPHRVDGSAILGAALLALSAQFVIWGAGGLENSLLNVLLAAAIWRALVEARTGGLPWSAGLWLGVALTRPEGILYAAIGGFWSLIFRFSREHEAVRDALSRPSELPAALWKALWPTLAWLAVFFVPFGLYQAWRFDYFAWELPNTYYAKKGNPGKAFEPFSWTRKGWKYLRGWAHHLGQGYLLPVYAVALLGVRGIRGATAALALVVLAVVLLVPGPEWLGTLIGWEPALPPWWVHTRVWVLLLASVLPVFVAIGRPGWRALVLAHSVVVAALFFAVYAGGDWMNGYRWMSTWSVPGAVLLAVGIVELADAARGLDLRSRALGVGLASVLLLIGVLLAVGLWIPPFGHLPGLGDVGGRDPSAWVLLGLVAVGGGGIAAGYLAQRGRPEALRWGPLAWVVMVALFGVAVTPSLTRLDKFVGKPTTSPWSVRRRVNYMNWVQAHLHMEERPTNLDVDMGATMYWSDDRIVDIAGLVDVPMGHRWFDRPFIAEYIFEEQRPHFAHVHGGWASTSRFKTYQAWKDGYLEIPPYPTGRTAQHPGNHVRKDLIVHPWDGPEGRATAFEGGLVLQGWDAPAGEGALGGHLYVELAWSTLKKRAKKADFRVWVFLARDGEVAHAWEAPAGYDWYPPHDWEPDEVVVSRHSLPLPADIGAGAYDLGIAVVGGTLEEDAVRALGLPDRPVDDPGVPEGAVLDPEQAVFVRGEVRWLDAVRLDAREQVEAHADEDRARARSLAAEGACGAAEEAWLLARRRLTRTSYDEDHKAEMIGVLAGCRARSAEALDDREARVAALEKALRWDHHAPDLWRVRAPLVDALMEEGRTARADKDWDTAYAAFRDVLRIDPRWSWARRWAVEARDCRLRIHLDEHDCGDVQPGAAAPRSVPIVPPEPVPDEAETEPPRRTRLPFLRERRVVRPPGGEAAPREEDSDPSIEVGGEEEGP